MSDTASERSVKCEACGGRTWDLDAHIRDLCPFRDPKSPGAHEDFVKFVGGEPDTGIQEREAELLPCPFCGSDAGVYGIDRTGYFAQCNGQDCDITIGQDFSGDHEFRTRSDARTAWNRRTPSSSIQEAAEKKARAALKEIAREINVDTEVLGNIGWRIIARHFSGERINCGCPPDLCRAVKEKLPEGVTCRVAVTHG